MTVIASDGRYIEPVDVSTLTIVPGERFDFLLNSTGKSGTYRIRWGLVGNPPDSKII